jgi:NADPH-dependent 7-cyano-7-deazaguanine reductase QueF
MPGVYVALKLCAPSRYIITHRNCAVTHNHGTKIIMDNLFVMATRWNCVMLCFRDGGGGLHVITSSSYCHVHKKVNDDG